MGRSPSCSDEGLKKGPWSPEEDKALTDYINQNGHGSWQALPKKAGLNRCGKSCRLRWTNYLRPDIKRGRFSDEEEKAIINLHSIHGNKWSTIASHLPGRTDNEIKNYWNTHMRKKLIKSGIDPKTHKPIYDFNLLSNLSQLLSISNIYNLMNPLEIALTLQSDFAQATNAQLIQNILQATNSHNTLLANNFQENIFMRSHNLDGINIMETNAHYSQDPFQGFSMLPTYPNSDEILINNVERFSSAACSSETEYLLPALDPASPNLYQIDNIDKPYNTPTCSFPTSIFEDWDNALGHEENGSIWKDIAP